MSDGSCGGPRGFGVRESSSIPRGVLLALVFAAALNSGCKSQAERQAAQEVGRIKHAVDTLRDAPNNAKSGPLEQLRAESCSAAEACELQQVCVQAYSLHLKALDTTNKVRQAMREQRGDPASVGQLLALSEADLERAKQLMDRCVALEGELEREHL